MKKIMTAVALSFSALMATSVIYADPPFGHKHGHNKGGNGNGNAFGHEKRGFREFRQDEEYIQEQRREREERGVRRLQQHRWQPGYVMPQHYRGDSYKVGYKDHNLPKPSRNQQWYKINNDYILVDSDSNSILKILGL
ncbi:RcnB family protein [Acinetobacter stercoris]|uniref:RcnB family protein n=1 Tax=Acinetobacter stercoris TaxID=2126983 RepID=A0A2U3N2D0_9GAMM|nr:RcnB family protein [Acinetobacter stercoris]SPL71828.1 hypothetical protein KPC_3006 [Acinetobacter stercoris]